MQSPFISPSSRRARKLPAASANHHKEIDRLRFARFITPPDSATASGRIDAPGYCRSASGLHHIASYIIEACFPDSFSQRATQLQ